MTKKDNLYTVEDVRLNIARSYRFGLLIGLFAGLIVGAIIIGYIVISPFSYQKGFEDGQKNISWGRSYGIYNISEIISFFEFDNSLFDQTSFSFVDRGLEQCYSDKKHPTLALCNYQREKWVMINKDGTWTASWRDK